ncbi:MAG: FAD:protein FMN transferase [Methylophilaceae bacterium]|nr:FAD:protein FMN transferase [Methylophilaceae bacterium]
MQKKEYIFGTIVEVTIYGETKDHASDAIELVFKEFRRLHNYLHPWKKSIIQDINQSIKNEKIYTTDDEEILSIIKHNKELESMTSGYFNPAIGNLIKAWGFHRDQNPTDRPNSILIDNLQRNLPHMSEINIHRGYIESKNKNIQLDLGGYAKGYALDQAKKILSENNINNALINIGGNILALGKHGDRNWVVGIQNPRKPNPIGSISLNPGWSIGTSGDYQRYFIVDNQRYSHLIDPNTGYPATNSQSATVLLPPIESSGTLSDVYSKPLFIAPEKLKFSIAKELGIDFYMIVMADGKISISNDMLSVIKWHEKIDEKNITVH